MRPEAAQLRLWRHEPWTFVRQCLGAEPDFWQDEFLHALVGLYVDGKPFARKLLRFALQACKGPGKSTVLAWAMWWFMVTRPHPKIVACSITAESLTDNLWAELAKWQKTSRLLSAAFVWTQDRIYEPRNPETWFMSARAYPKSSSPQQQAETLAGIHADFVMFVLDESGSIPPGVLATADAGLANVGEAAGREALLLQAGNPTDVTGSLAVAAVAQREYWWVKEISGDPDDPHRAARVSIDWARQVIAQYGRNHPFVMVNVLGRFPPGAANTLISLHDVTAAKDRKLGGAAYANAPLIMGVDVARFGEDETALCLRQGPLCYPFDCYRQIDSMQVAAHVGRIINEKSPAAVFIDSTGGYGGGVIDRLLELGFRVQGVNFSDAPMEWGYLNKRAEMWSNMATWFKGEVSIPDDPRLISELPSPTYKYTSNNQLQLEAKADMKKRGLSSPDRGDALALTFAFPVAHAAHHAVRPETRVVQTRYDWRTHNK